jgi:hypothetical protein
MTGTIGDIIPIVIVPVIVLAFWLGMMFYTSSHPQWRGQAPTHTALTHVPEGSIPAQRQSSPHPVVPGPAASEVTPGQARADVAPR